MNTNLAKSKEFNDLCDFYNQVLHYFPEELSENYQQMHSFYLQMLSNRGAYFKEQIKKIDAKLEVLYHQQSLCLKSLNKITVLFQNTEFISDIQGLNEKINNKQQIVAEYEYKIKLYSEKSIINKQIKKEKDELKKKYFVSINFLMPKNQLSTISSYIIKD